MEPNAVPGWVREPNVGFSQVGYLPAQPKVSVIELDKADKVRSRASVWKVEADGSSHEAFTGPVKVWGDYFKYRYAKFDFTQVQEPGVYFLRYGDVTTGNFIIGDDVYDRITVATSDVWIPVHMNHMAVHEAYRLWHGEPFREGYLQAPPGTDHFDLHWQGPSTDTKYKALELIPGLNVGGYFDAGDFDIEHGVLNLVAQAEQIGHMSQTLSNSVLDNYHHLGDAAGITDGLHYDPRLKPYEKSADGKSSGTPDDMWAFTNRNPVLALRLPSLPQLFLRGGRGGGPSQAGLLREQPGGLLVHPGQHGPGPAVPPAGPFRELRRLALPLGTERRDHRWQHRLPHLGRDLPGLTLGSLRRRKASC